MLVHTYAISDGSVHLSVVGEIDIATVEDFEEALARAIAIDGAPRVVVDFSEVTFCDSSGLAALDRCCEQASHRGLQLRLVRPQRGVRRLLELTGLLEALTRPDI
ncbi:STAS domain-containing protein [Actinoplanes sp. Pm04-4]|uniref:Anti-sigma factor antagonist n=1 Tax=Paractinoplanes pyxinae TaxID=2997416 RepID=A0ABT4BF76_9ACTN|nr:STAS domain-containing protein [Actinoplanes pyxinae]MCY1144223.1 STAS domain-containing protein [Actinoplanes pyxinae]